MVHLLLQIPAALLSDEGSWVWGWQENTTCEPSAELDGEQHDSIVLRRTGIPGCEAVSAVSQRRSTCLTCERGFVGCACTAHYEFGPSWFVF